MNSYRYQLTNFFYSSLQLSRVFLHSNFVHELSLFLTIFLYLNRREPCSIHPKELPEICTYRITVTIRLILCPNSKTLPVPILTNSTWFYTCSGLNGLKDGSKNVRIVVAPLVLDDRDQALQAHPTVNMFAKENKSELTIVLWRDAQVKGFYDVNGGRLIEKHLNSPALGIRCLFFKMGRIRQHWDPEKCYLFDKKNLT
jgi:hypothetical protein